MFSKVFILALVCVIAVHGACKRKKTPPKPTSGSDPVFVTLQNKIRSEVSPTAANMVKLVYSAKLTADAQKAVNRCKFEHSSAGENLFASWGGPVKSTDELMKMAVEAWEEEKTSKKANYKYRKYSKSSGSSGHYNQIIWADSTTVGCAHKRCGEKDYITCRYYPYGNYMGQYPYEKGSRGSKCPAGEECV